MNNNYNNGGIFTNGNLYAQKHNASHETLDFGANPFVVDIDKATVHNDTYRTALWTGKHLQLTLMSINPGDDIGLEIHPDTDQFLRIESGSGVAHMGNAKDDLYCKQPVYENSAVFVPAGTWHNVVNTGDEPLKLYTVYAPPHHPWGTVEKRKPSNI